MATTDNYIEEQDDYYPPSGLKERRGNQHKLVSNSAVFGYDFIKPEDISLERCYITRVVQAATSTYENCYVDSDEEGRYVEYKPADLRKLTIAEMEAMGQWYIPKTIY